jgi:hypothetical protein
MPKAPGALHSALQHGLQCVADESGLDVTDAEPAAQLQRGHNLAAYQFKRGQSGNPAGRPKGSRNKLGEAFLADLYADWVENGAAAIKKARETRPEVYLKVIASILPKQLEIERDPFDGVTDDQLAALIAAARNALGIEEEVEGARDETAH